MNKRFHRPGIELIMVIVIMGLLPQLGRQLLSMMGSTNVRSSIEIGQQQPSK